MINSIITGIKFEYTDTSTKESKSNTFKSAKVYYEIHGQNQRIDGEFELTGNDELIALLIKQCKDKINGKFISLVSNV